MGHHCELVTEKGNKGIMNELGFEDTNDLENYSSESNINHIEFGYISNKCTSTFSVIDTWVRVGENGADFIYFRSKMKEYTDNNN